MEHLDPNDPLNYYFATDLAAITEDLEFDGYESPPEPDASAYEKALDDVAHKAAVANNYDPHAIDKAVHDAEREVWWLDQAIRGLVGMVEDGIQPEPHTLVA